MADNFGLKIGVEGEKEFKKALADINRMRAARLETVLITPWIMLEIPLISP